MTTNEPESLPIWLAEDKWHDDEVVIRFSDYERLQAELEQWKKGIAIRDEQNEELHQYVLELKTEIEKLRTALAESRANDQQAMAYLSEVRAIVGGDDFPDMVRRCEKLRKDAEFGRSVLSKRESGKAYGCHCDLEEDMEPDGCVIDEGNRLDCVYARRIETKEQCEYWRVIVTDAKRG